MSFVTSSRSSLLSALLLVAAIALAFWWWPGTPAQALVPPEPASPPDATVPHEPAEPAVAPLPTPESAGVAAADCITYPDGSLLPPLNGVKKAPPMVFHRRVPFSKVTGKERDRNGVEWYVHENGARSTTRLMWKNGVQEAVSEISLPAEPKPLVGDK
ncbi:MAG TPA: hypothetical protein VF384_17785 [Planctomycetota bacterium]